MNVVPIADKNISWRTQSRFFFAIHKIKAVKTRIIPTLLFKNHSLVKGKNFDSSRVVGSVLESVKLYDAREVDELIFLDIDATKNKSDPEYDYIATISKDCPSEFF